MAGEDRPGQKLTTEQYEAAIAWLLEKRGDHTCPSCGQHDFYVSESLAGIPVQIIDGPLFLGTSYPCVVVVCKHCAFVMLYSAIAMGLHVGKPLREEKGEHKEKEESHVQSS